jgi:hypothetical protein
MAESGTNSSSINMSCEQKSSVIEDSNILRVKLEVNTDGNILTNIGEPAPSPLRITMTDSHEQYVCHHYIECDSKSNDVLKNTRGVISKNGEVVCRTFKFVPEFIGKSQEAIDALKNIDWNDAIFYPAHEGTNLRLWFDEGRWHISSFKKIDAFRSRWGCKESHGQMFYDALEFMLKNGKSSFPPATQAVWDDLSKQNPDQEACFNFYCSLLSPSIIYTFVVLSTIKNRIVCNSGVHSQPLYFTGEFSKSGWIMLKDNSSGILPPSAIIEYDIENMAESLLSYVEKLDPYLWQGLMIHYNVGTEAFGSIKLTSAAYQSLAILRDNTPSVPFRYLQLREWPDQARALMALYPEHAERFNDYELILDNLMNEVLAGYVLRYVKKQFVMLPQELFFIVKDLNNQWHVDHKRVTKRTVINKFNTLGSIKLNYLIKCAKQRAVEELEAELNS